MTYQIGTGLVCLFVDDSIGQWMESDLLTPTQLETCLQVMLESEMFALNDCPPGGS